MMSSPLLALFVVPSQSRSSIVMKNKLLMLSVLASKMSEKY